MKNLLLVATLFVSTLSFAQEKYNPLAAPKAVKPLVIRFDMPLLLNRPPASDEDFYQMRWLIGINKTL